MIAGTGLNFCKKDHYGVEVLSVGGFTCGVHGIL